MKSPPPPPTADGRSSNSDISSVTTDDEFFAMLSAKPQWWLGLPKTFNALGDWLTDLVEDDHDPGTCILVKDLGERDWPNRAILAGCILHNIEHLRQYRATNGDGPTLCSIWVCSPARVPSLHRVNGAFLSDLPPKPW